MRHPLPPQCDILMFGRELEVNHDSPSYGSHKPSARTLHIARWVAALWNGIPEPERDKRIGRIYSSGGHPALACNMTRPPDSSNEAEFMQDELCLLGVPPDKIIIDPYPEHTFDNVSGVIERCFMHTGTYDYRRIWQPNNRYTPEYPLVIAANEAHLPRACLLTRHALNISRQSMRLLWPKHPEYDETAYEKEIMLTKLTQCAILESDVIGFPPGSVGCTDHVLQVFGGMWDKREEHIARFDQTNPGWHLRLPDTIG